jgi:hypothetical protein
MGSNQFYSYQNRLADGTFSDQIVLLRAYRGWVAAKEEGRPAEREFCKYVITSYPFDYALLV